MKRFTGKMTSFEDSHMVSELDLHGVGSRVYDIKSIMVSVSFVQSTSVMTCQRYVRVTLKAKQFLMRGRLKGKKCLKKKEIVGK